MKPNSSKGQGLVTDLHILSKGGRGSQVTDKAKPLGQRRRRKLGGPREACGAAGQDEHGKRTRGLHLNGTKESRHGQKKTEHKSHPLTVYCII